MKVALCLSGALLAYISIFAFTPRIPCGPKVPPGIVVGGVLLFGGCRGTR